MSESMRRIWADPEKHRQWTEALRHTSADPEVRKHKSEGIRRAWDDPEKRKRWTEANRRKSADPEVRKLISEAVTRTWTLERRRSVSEQNKNVWAEHRAKVQAARQPSAKSAKRRGRPPKDDERATVQHLKNDLGMSWAQVAEKTGWSKSKCRHMLEGLKEETPSAQPLDATGA